MTFDVRLHVSEVGWRTTLQDLGRRGSERLGVPRGGSADQGAARIANILVGNPQSRPVIESLGGAFAFVPSHDVLAAATGSVGRLTIGGCAVDAGQPLAVPAGIEIRIECSDAAARTYVAVNGELDAARFLGSVAPDSRMGFGQTVAADAELHLATGVTRIDQPFLGRVLFHLPVPERHLPDGPWTIDIVACAETDRIPGIRELLSTSGYHVTERSDHVGIRLDGPVLHPPDDSEIVSHGVPIGAIEIPHSDELIVLGRYRTLTAGYPIVGFATRLAQDLIGQARSGRELRFAWTDHHAARTLSTRFEAELAVLEAAAANAFAALDLPIGASDALALSSKK
ncbi:5-oxoprolinase subunit C family protein [Luethyella okanaganae]|uniref:Biotin-dependent carboxyltransferase family protein n=1 Tax=Luethyella okanaganae TaxID=69372 RepID=A0ABW1VD74_9MICO